MLRWFAADLHVHTVLSPCAEYTMVPELIVARALDAGIEILGITDHNSGDNTGAVVRAAHGSGIEVLPGIEVESREGVHLLTLFDDIGQLMTWQRLVHRSLPDRENDVKAFGAQLVVTDAGEFVREERRLLSTAVSLSFAEIASTTNTLGGLCIPSHIDRPAYGLLNVLGFVPDEPNVLALEVSFNCDVAGLIAEHPSLAGRALVRSSDAHSIAELGRAFTLFRVHSASVRELTLAFRRREGRRVITSRLQPAGQEASCRISNRDAPRAFTAGSEPPDGTADTERKKGPSSQSRDDEPIGRRILSNEVGGDKG